MDGKRALIIDDEPDIRELLEITLGRMNIETEAVADLRTARDLLHRGSFDLCLTDLQLPDGNGLDLVQELADEQPSLTVVVITAFGSMDAAIRALKCGAFDFVEKPVDLERLRQLVDAALRLEAANQADSSRSQLIGSSRVMEQLRGRVAKLARSQAPVYISGESGSGKEVAARLIHEQGPRVSAPFVPVNCGAIPNELMESEFFGHVKGSFTGAHSDKDGLFTAAQGGTLFLDEVADLPISMQVKLLRAIQEKAIRRVGAHSEMPLDVRILSATHKDLGAEVAAGRFRQDLYYRLNVIELSIPSLRERKADIAELTSHILKRLADSYQGEAAQLSADALATLHRYDFPGNVRELENILERAYTLCEEGQIETRDLQLKADTAARSDGQRADQPAATQDQRNTRIKDTVATKIEAPLHPDGGSFDWLPALSEDQSLESSLEAIERELINRALENTRWNKTAAAKELGITFRALRYRLKKLKLE